MWYFLEQIQNHCLFCFLVSLKLMALVPLLAISLKLRDNKVFQSFHGPENPLVFGAAKSCVGHAETVSGLVGVIKTLSSFAAGAVPGLVQPTADNMNPSINCSVVPLHIPFETVELKKLDGGPLCAMILWVITGSFMLFHL
jgi:Beta-ketoacyl synthase, C-terminal domain